MHAASLFLCAGVVDAADAGLCGITVLTVDHCVPFPRIAGGCTWCRGCEGFTRTQAGCHGLRPPPFGCWGAAARHQVHQGLWPL